MANKVWHRETVTDSVVRAIAVLGAAPWIARFYLAGGTGLALHLGHRRSVDVDLFSAEAFEPNDLIGYLRKRGTLSIVTTAPATLHVTFEDTKVSFLGYEYPVLDAYDAFNGVNVASPRDIACMKLSAIASRGTRRDFVDVYEIARIHRLGELVDLFQRKFAEVQFSKVHLLKSLTYFADAEKEPMPDMLVPVSWREIRRFFEREVPKLV